LLGHERLHSLRGKAILEEEKRCESLPHEETKACLRYTRYTCIRRKRAYRANI
jgi:hypothetical protein